MPWTEARLLQASRVAQKPFRRGVVTGLRGLFCSLDDGAMFACFPHACGKRGFIRDAVEDSSSTVPRSTSLVRGTCANSGFLSVASTLHRRRQQ